MAIYNQRLFIIMSQAATYVSGLHTDHHQGPAKPRMTPKNDLLNCSPCLRDLNPGPLTPKSDVLTIEL
jgi:hypothetical protein